MAPSITTERKIIPLCAPPVRRAKLRLLQIHIDDPDAVAAELQQAGIPFEAQNVASVKDLKATVERFAPDAILWGYRGFDSEASALERTRKAYPDVPFVVVTAGSEPANELLKIRATAYVTKDRPDELVHVVEQILRDAEHRLERDRVTFEMQVASDERDRAERERREAEQRFQALAEQNVAGIYVVGSDLKIEYVNPGFVSMMGYVPDEVRGRSVFDFMAESQKALVREALLRALSGEPTPPMTVEMLRKDGKSAEVFAHSTLSTSEGRRAVIGIAIDVTQLRAAERELAVRNVVLKTQQEASPDGILVVDDDQRIVSFNRRFVETFSLDAISEGVSYEEALKIAAPQLRNSNALAEKLKALLENREQESHSEFALRDGRVLEEHSAPMWDPNHSYLGRVFFIRDVTERRRGEKDLFRSNRALRTVSGCNVALARASNEQELLSETCRVVVEKGEYRAAFIAFAERDENKGVRIVAHAGWGDDSAAESWSARLSWDAANPYAQGSIGTAIRTGQVQSIRDIQTDPKLEPWRPLISAFDLKSNIVLPLKDETGTYGVLAIFESETDAFDPDEFATFAELADDVAFGIRMLRVRNEHASTLRQLEQNMDATVQAIGRAVEFRDPYTSGHQHRVAKLASAIGIEMKLSDQEIQAIRIAALVHDVGKIYVPAEILTKPGKLSKLELDLIKVHAQAGGEILESIEFPWPVAKIVRQHHERLDGSGYPDGLKGDQILLSARVIAVADVMESMMTHRPYRPAFTIQDALNELARGRDRLYDPDAVDACTKLFHQFNFD